MRQFQIRTLQIQIRLLILAHAKNLFIWIQRFKACSQMVIAAGNRAEFSRLDFNGTALRVKNISPISRVFLEQFFACAVIDRQFAAG